MLAPAADEWGSVRVEDIEMADQRLETTSVAGGSNHDIRTLRVPSESNTSAPSKPTTAAMISGRAAARQGRSSRCAADEDVRPSKRLRNLSLEVPDHATNAPCQPQSRDRQPARHLESVNDPHVGPEDSEA
jgi:hypothetical protein